MQLVMTVIITAADETNSDSVEIEQNCPTDTYKWSVNWIALRTVCTKMESSTGRDGWELA